VSPMCEAYNYEVWLQLFYQALCKTCSLVLNIRLKPGSLIFSSVETGVVYVDCQHVNMNSGNTNNLFPAEKMVPASAAATPAPPPQHPHSPIHHPAHRGMTRNCVCVWGGGGDNTGIRTMSPHSPSRLFPPPHYYKPLVLFLLSLLNFNSDLL